MKPLYSKIIFKGKMYAMYTFLIQRLSSSGFSDSSIRALVTLHRNSSDSAAKPQDLRCCWPSYLLQCKAAQASLSPAGTLQSQHSQAEGLRSLHSIVATPPCPATALQHCVRPQLIRSRYSSSTLLDLSALHVTPVLTLC